MRFVFQTGIDPRVRACCKKFYKWLCKRIEFQGRLTVYLLNHRRIFALDGDIVCGTIFFPDDEREPPFIRVAAKCALTDDQSKNDDELAGVLGTIAHELGHALIEQSRCVVKSDALGEELAERIRNEILDEYAQGHKTLCKINRRGHHA